MLNNPLTEQENQAMLRLCVLAAFADGAQEEVERAQIEKIISGTGDQKLDSALAYQEILSGRLGLPQIAAEVQSPSARALAYEMAVCVCNADGVLKEPERQFLTQLRQELQLAPASVEGHEQAAQALVEQPLATAAPPVIDAGRESGIQETILNTAILTGALELMPHTLATMAIVPIQVRMVYKIGKQYGYELDRGHIKDFLATVGAGMTSQVFQGFAQRFVSRLTRHVAGRLIGGLAGQAAGSAVSFGSTYALGQVAQRYYSSGRTLSTSQLKDVFASMLDQGRTLQTRYSGDVLRKSQTLNMSELLPLVRS
jgi:uncharacterized protein (DUF697 family)/tellurite resistance protein